MESNLKKINGNGSFRNNLKKKDTIRMTVHQYERTIIDRNLGLTPISMPIITSH